MRDDKLKYTCVGCHKPVIRVTQGCDVSKKLCSKCVTNSVKSATDNLADSLSQAPKQAEVYDFYRDNERRIGEYEAIINKVKTLNRPDTTKTFVTLYEQAKREMKNG